ncbi:uncharacterized protein MKK02DRAFT_43075 [Dioszegia hungarica]|uniref:F-box domain-containing protein n=1 Tax=Dioszegia hungarica TaxID=4972 RepID=A0AA38HDX8_9TREE|nr:uncharacterized protein MKK02DRAFT_43075 [Dioszegia hungarica]KAI9638673.1 hypothetical protein MKK02DRAFT_43075 [Dioszegia hungarica]
MAARQPTPHAGVNPHLPLEIYAHILTFLQKPDLAIAARVCRSFYLIATPRLYKDLCISSGHHNPLYHCEISATHHSRRPRMRYLPTAQGARANMTPFGLGPLPDRFSFTRQLFLGRYHEMSCLDHTPLSTPLLQQLSIIDSADDSPCQSTLTLFKVGAPSVPMARCPLLANLRPTRLICGAPGDYEAGLWLSAGVPVLPTWIREMVLCVDVHPDRHISPNRRCDALTNLPATLQKFSLLLNVEPGRWASDMERLSHSSLEGLLLSPEDFLRNLAGLCRRDAEVVEIVGAKRLEAEGWGMPYELIEREIRKEVKEWAMWKGWDEACAEIRGEGIEFVTKDEYDKRGRGYAGFGLVIQQRVRE